MESPTDSTKSGAAARASGGGGTAEAPLGRRTQAAGIRLENVTKVYLENAKPAVDDVSFEIADGEFMVLVGPSGCGKSTLLRVIAGLETVTAGRVLIGEDDVTDVRPQSRDLAMVFQNYALYPHMTVAGNLAFGLRLRHIDKADRERRVSDVAHTLGLDELLDRKPGELSGGQRQRVAMGRAMVREPKAFLMDEPLSNLDAKLRVSMRAELARLHERLGVTTVYVTHDQVEAMTLGQRVAVLRDGVLQQVDTAQRLFREPANLFVAAFIGSPSMNLVEADVADARLHFGGFELPLPDGLRLPQRRVIVGIRPTDFQDGDQADANLPRMRVRATVVEDLGAESHVIFAIDAPRVVAEAVRTAEDVIEPAEGLLADDDRALFTARVDGQHFVSPGDELDLAVDPRRMHFFDPTTGAVLGR
jgi:multiple sugar transport system ATP-binding protein